MNIFFDLKTIFISLVAGDLFTVFLICAYWREHKGDTKFNTFFLAKCFQSVAWILQIFRGTIPNVLSISLSNTVLFLGAAFEAIALLEIQQAFNSKLKKMYILLTLCGMIGFNLIVLFYNEERIRIAVASIGTSVLILFPAFLMVKQRTSSLLMKLMGYFYLVVVVSSFGRTIAALFTNRSLGLFTPGIYQMFSFVSLCLILIFGNTGFVLLLKEKTDQELLWLACYDDLTGTLNRRTFISRAKQCLTDYAKKKRPLSLLFFDVDNFKHINDTLGHDTGDRVLQDLAKRIHQHISADQLFGRYGGDEFFILLPGMDEIRSTEKAEQIRLMIDKVVVEGFPVSYTLSLGVITVIPNEQTDIDKLFISCDRALYLAKRNGRNRVFRADVTRAGDTG